MINSKKTLSIMATMITCLSTTSIQTCAMEDSNDYEQIKKMEENDSEENYEFLEYEGRTFFNSIFDILQDIARCVNVYYIKETGNYIFIYECNVLEPTEHLEQHTYPFLANHDFKDLNKGLKYIFYECLKSMLEILTENPCRNILFHNQKRRVYLHSSEGKYADAFLNNKLEKGDCVDKCVDIQLCAWKGKIDVIKINSMEEMEDLLKNFFPDYDNSFELNFIEKTQKSGKK